MFEYLIFFSRILIGMWIKRYVIEILWQRLPDLSICGGLEITCLNAVGVMKSKWHSESDKNFCSFWTDQTNQSYLHFLNSFNTKSP